MVLESLLGGIVGGAARLAPEVLKFFDRKNERQHELAMNQFQLQLIREQGHTKLEGDQIAADAAQVVAGLDAVKTAYQSQKTGFKFADTISALVRPWVTFMIVHVWLLVKVAAYVQLTGSGLSWDVAVQTIWSANDVAMLAGIINFWFLGRVFEKKRR